MDGKELVARAKAEALKHKEKGTVFHVTMPNEACFIDLDENQIQNLMEHAAERKLSVHVFDFSKKKSEEEGTESKSSKKK